MDDGSRQGRLARLALALGSLASGATCAAATAVDAGAATTSDPIDRSLLAAVNEVRREHGVAPVGHSRRLDRAATGRSRDMARRGYFAHVLPGGTPYWARVRLAYPAAGFRTWRIGENLFWSVPRTTSSGVVGAWLRSPSHRRVLLRPYWREAGVGAVRSTSSPGHFQGRPVTIVTLELGVRR